MNHFQTPNGITGLGDWSIIINDLDPFRDRRASHRIGTYLQWLIEGFNKGLNREKIMDDAANYYVDKWGIDKVVTIGATT